MARTNYAAMERQHNGRHQLHQNEIEIWKNLTTSIEL